MTEKDEQSHEGKSLQSVRSASVVDVHMASAPSFIAPIAKANSGLRK